MQPLGFESVSLDHFFLQQNGWTVSEVNVNRGMIVNSVDQLVPEADWSTLAQESRRL